MSQSLVNEGGGARTPLSGVVAAGLILIVTLFFSQSLSALPQPVLAAIVLVAVAGLFKYKALKELWRFERPEFVDQLSKQIPFFALRHSVKPGITGWAQVRYAYGASVDDAVEKLQHDLYYVKNHSLFLDIMILIATVEVVLWGKGAR